MSLPSEHALALAQDHADAILRSQAAQRTVTQLHANLLAMNQRLSSSRQLISHLDGMLQTSKPSASL